MLAGTILDRLASLLYPSSGHLMLLVATGLVGALVGLLWRETSGG